MRHFINEPWQLPFNRFSARPTELNIYLLLFLGLGDTKQMEPEEINSILLHDLPNSCEKQYYTQG